MLRVRLAALVAAMMVGLAATAAAQGAVAKETTAKSGEVKVNEFMTYDPGSKTVDVHLSSALGSANGGMNFNGGAKGDQTITVPQGWHVIMDFENKDAIPHSAIVIPDKFPLPAQPQDPALARAYTTDVTAGLPTGGTDTMDFKASKPGDYLIACGVPGHAPSGMYIKFVVSPTATAPGYKK